MISILVSSLYRFRYRYCISNRYCFRYRYRDRYRYCIRYRFRLRYRNRIRYWFGCVILFVIGFGCVIVISNVVGIVYRVYLQS